MTIQQQSAEVVSASIVLSAKNDRETLLQMLKSSGFLVDENSSEDDLIEASLIGIKENPRFKKEFTDYLVLNLKEENLSADGDDTETLGEDLSYLDSDFFNYVDEDFLNNDGKTKAGKILQGVGKGFKSLFKTKEGADTTFGKALKDNADGLVKIGVDALGTAITNRANRSNNKLAVEMSKAEGIRLFQENVAKGLITPDGKAIVPPSSDLGDVSNSTTPPDQQKKNKWVLPVVIVGGIVVLGVVAYFLTRKKGAVATATPTS